MLSEPREVEAVQLAPCTVQEKYMHPNLEKLKRCGATLRRHQSNTETPTYTPHSVSKYVNKLCYSSFLFKKHCQRHNGPRVLSP